VSSVYGADTLRDALPPLYPHKNARAARSSSASAFATSSPHTTAHLPFSHLARARATIAIISFFFLRKILKDNTSEVVFLGIFLRASVKTV